MTYYIFFFHCTTGKKPRPPSVSTLGTKPGGTTDKAGRPGKPKVKMPTPPESPRETNNTFDHVRLNHSFFRNSIIFNTLRKGPFQNNVGK